MLENTIHSIVGLARAEKALFTVTGISLGPFLHIDPAPPPHLYANYGPGVDASVC